MKTLLKEKNNKGVLIMNKRILPIVALFMLAIGSGILAQAAVTTYFTPEENLMVLNLPKLGFWENERDDGGYYTIMDEEGNVHFPKNQVWEG